jgi:hypothetical protein
MFLGAAIGALVLLRICSGAVPALTLALLLIVLALAAPHRRSTDAWTAPWPVTSAKDPDFSATLELQSGATL